MRLGLDFGTTNSTIALYDGEQLHTLVVDPTNDNPHVMPSLLYIDRRRRETVGAKAAETYLKAETGRPVRWRRRDAGDVEITVASFDNDPIEFTQTINVLVDIGARGRLLQSIKTALFNERYEGTHIFGRFYRLETLIAIILRQLKQVAEARFERHCDCVMMGRPVRFSHNPMADSRAEAILLKAAHLAGFTDVRFEYEPVGIAHLYHRSSTERQTVLVFDFGGGTLDLTIARVGGEQPPEILATQGVLVGGNDLDRRIMESLLPHFGGGDENHLPPQMIDKLMSWQTMPELSQPQAVERIRELQQTSSDPTPYYALETLVSRNLGFKLFKEIERVKQALSTADSVTLHFNYDNIHINKPITRRRFERMIAPEINLVEQGLQEIIASANLRPVDIDVVLRTGGSSLVPAFYRLLSSYFGEDKQREIDPLVSVVGGFAVSAYDHEQALAARRQEAEQLIAELHHDGCEVYQTEIGAATYTDRDFVINRIPNQLNKIAAIRTRQQDFDADKPDALTFTLHHSARVYVAYEANVLTLPYWLRRFKPQQMQVEVRDEYALISRVMWVYARDFPAGKVTLGGNQAAGYTGSVILNYLVFLEQLKETPTL